MTAAEIQTYDFHRLEHWRTCLLAGLAQSGDSLLAQPRLDPGSGADVDAEAPAKCPVHLPDKRLVWIAAGKLRSFPSNGGRLPPMPAPADMAAAVRLTAGAGCIYAVPADGNAVSVFDAGTFQKLTSHRAEDLWDDGDGAKDVHIIDADADPCGGHWVLLSNRARSAVLRLGRGNEKRAVLHDARAMACAWLDREGDGGTIVILEGKPASLRFICGSNLGQAGPVKLEDLPNGFEPSRLYSNGTDRLYLTGRVSDSNHWCLVALDGEGSQLGHLELGGAGDTPITCTAKGDAVWIAGDFGLRRYSVGGAGNVAASAGQLLSPTLRSPPGFHRGWRQALLKISLPAGSGVRVRFASTDDGSLRDQINSIMRTRSRPPNKRIARILELLEGPDLHTADFKASAIDEDLTEGEGAVSRIVPLHLAQGEFLWIAIEFLTSGSATPPALRQLQVSAPDLSLMEQLPAIFRGPDGDEAGTLRALVGVLEAITGDLGDRISRIGTLIDPRSAPEVWLDAVAGWLGLPWHSALSVTKKRQLLAGAADLLKWKGTRASLMGLLSILFPGDRIGIDDWAADMGPAVLGGGSASARLPAILLGRPRNAMMLAAARARLGAARLICGDDRGNPSELLRGRLRIRLASHRKPSGHDLSVARAMIGKVVPLGTRLTIAWRSLEDLTEGIDLTSEMELRAAPAAAVNGPVGLGQARLARPAVTRLSAAGGHFGIELR